MNHKTNFALLGSLFFITFVNAQTPPLPRELPAKRTTQPVKIDGLINDAAWKDAAAGSPLDAGCVQHGVCSYGRIPWLPRR